MNTVSVIVPMYNCEKTIKRCVDSILNQTYKKVEIILIDDGSSDDTFNFCMGEYHKISRVKIIKQKNMGPSAARNRGLKIAQGEYIIFVDSDDYIDENFIESLMNNKSENKLIGTQYRKINYLKKVDSKRNINYKSEEYIVQILNGTEIGVIWGFLFERSLIESEFDINTSFMEDTLFLINYLNKVKSVEFINSNVKKIFYNHTINENSITNDVNRVFKNINDFLYSLTKIDELTKLKYSELILNKKISLIEKECRNLDTTDDFKNIMLNEEIKNTILARKTKNLFTFLYQLNNPFVLKMYYKIRKFIKRIYINIR